MLMRYGPLYAGSFLLIASSLGCSFWFFYSFLNGEGGPQFSVLGTSLPLLGVVAGLVGCGAQLFVYSFTANMRFIRNGLMKLLVVMVSMITIGLSMFSTYSTLISYLDRKTDLIANQEKQAEYQQFAINQQRILLESRVSDMNTNTDSAKLAVGDGYRSQGANLTASNEALRDKQLKQVLSMGEIVNEPVARTASPLDGMASVVGNARWASVGFCVTLAALFDLLPLLGIAMIGHLRNHQESARESQLSKAEEHHKPVNTDININIQNTQVAAKSIASDADEKAGSLVAEVIDTAIDNTDEQLNESPVINMTADNESRKKEHEAVVSKSDGQDQTETYKEKGEVKLNSLSRSMSMGGSQNASSELPIVRRLPIQYKNRDIDSVPPSVTFPIIVKALKNNELDNNAKSIEKYSGLKTSRVKRFIEIATANGVLIKKSAEAEQEGYRFDAKNRFQITHQDVNVKTIAWTI